MIAKMKDCGNECIRTFQCLMPQDDELPDRHNAVNLSEGSGKSRMF